MVVSTSRLFRDSPIPSYGPSLLRLFPVTTPSSSSLTGVLKTREPYVWYTPLIFLRPRVTVRLVRDDRMSVPWTVVEETRPTILVSSEILRFTPPVPILLNLLLSTPRSYSPPSDKGTGLDPRVSTLTFYFMSKFYYDGLVLVFPTYLQSLLFRLPIRLHTSITYLLTTKVIVFFLWHFFAQIPLLLSPSSLYHRHFDSSLPGFTPTTITYVSSFYPSSTRINTNTHTSKNKTYRT